MTMPPLTTVPSPARAVPAAVFPARSRAPRTGRPRPRWSPFLFLLPYFAVTAVFFVYPLAYATVLSLVLCVAIVALWIRSRDGRLHSLSLRSPDRDLLVQAGGGGLRLPVAEEPTVDHHDRGRGRDPVVEDAFCA